MRSVTRMHFPRVNRLCLVMYGFPNVCQVARWAFLGILTFFFLFRALCLRSSSASACSP